jgi:hypothetical protein
MKLESSCSFNIATFQFNVLCSPASAVLTSAAPPKGSVYGLWILHSGLYTTEFGKTTSDTIFTVNCNLFWYIPSRTQFLTYLQFYFNPSQREKKTRRNCCLTTPLFHKITQTRIETENVPRHRNEESIGI